MKAPPLALGLLLTLALALAPTTAHAARPVDPALQAQIDDVLEAFPGGEQIGPRTISWDDGAVLLELAGATAARAVASCPTGRYCAWSGPNYSGQMLSLLPCSVSGSLASLGPLALYGGAKSFANARNSGTVTVLNGTTAVYALAASSGGNYAGASTQMRCFT